MIPWLVGSAVACVASKVIDNIDTGNSIDATDDFAALAKDEKNDVIRILNEEGIPQKDIARSFGISAPAVSQRLKRFSPSQNTTSNHNPYELSNIQRLIDLHSAGFSSKAISLLLQESNLNITKNDIESFIKVHQALEKQLTFTPKDTEND
ncbi:winged helix-turn-helix transcriptional regulator [Vibrio diabolicus]|uniref:winged helix-turn-helix transcriptional regulator n=1 Tax=Vibrio diabolicus TaxID=50719 RepID=UPI0035A8B179|nr:winged helix-turn-helix transcriptional regulator [Vibrio parahaemolyticus]EKH9203303.1 winged helix-turn-helix transcriptional regulator [Vibrio parahaemolyticus]